MTSATNVSVIPRLLRVAWLSVLLGLTMEGLLLLVAAGCGQHPAIKPVLADLVQKVSWASVVCVGLASGTAASKAWRGPAMGVAGLFAAPAGFAVARALHKSATQALAIAAPAAAGPSPLVLAAIKGVEYAVLGVLIARVDARRGAGLAAYARTGLVVGLTFGGFIVWLLTRTAVNPPLVLVLSRLVNELIFPVGCSLVLYAADALAARHTT